MFQDDTTGLRFGNFEVLVRPDGSVHELGRGGFGRTLLARHSLLDTEVALKLIDERHALNEAARTRFLKEAKEQARLTHPGIARITDCGIVEGQLYYAVELCPGGHLKEYVAATGPLNVADTFHILTQAAEALEYSHRRDVVHLDVKPSNLMLIFDEEGVPHVKLIDFGLVQRTSTEVVPAGTDGQPLFSPAFASPEQIRALPTDGRSDLFSLGLTAWYLLTGKNPVEGAADTVIRERLTPDEYESQLPAQLTGKPRWVIARLVRKNAAERYNNGAELLADLRACLQSMPPLGGGWQLRQRSSGALADHFILEKGTASRMGMVHPALARASRQRVKVTLLRRGTPPPVILQYQKAAEALRDSEGSGLVRVLEVREFTEGWAVVEEAASGASLTEILRREGALPLGRYAPLVWQLGHAMDTAFSASLTNVVLEEAMAELPPSAAGKNIDWSLVTIMVPVSPTLPEQPQSHDADVTRTGDFTLTTTSTVGGVQLLARWVYFITGGKNPPPSSLYSIKEYVNIPTLSEQANQIVARHLCGQSTTTRCEEMLRQIFSAEGLSWEVVGERVRGSRWNVIVEQAAAVMQDIEASVTAAEKIADACAPMAETMPNDVRVCYDAVSAVYASATSARTQQELLSRGTRDLKTGRTAVAGLEEVSRTAHAQLLEAEAAFSELKDIAEKQQRDSEQRQRRRTELMEALTGACRRTEAAAQEAQEIAEECRRLLPNASAARQMESLAVQTGALATQLGTLRDEAVSAPESDWSRLESQVPRARQIATDADEMARACHSLLEKAKAEARRREEDEKRRAAITKAVAEVIRQAENSTAEASAIVEEINSLAARLPSLAETERRAKADAARLSEGLAALQALQIRDDDAAPQEAATAADDVRRIVDALRDALGKAQQAVAEEDRLVESVRAATAAIEHISAAAEKSATAAAQQFASHGMICPTGTPAADSLVKAAAAAGASRQCHEEISALASAVPTRRTEAGRLVEQARELAAAGERHATQSSRYLRDAAEWLQEAERQARVEAENARARAASAIAAAIAQVEREVKRTREAFMRAGQHADVPAATAAVASASEAWSACQDKQRTIRHWQSARPPEAASDEDYLDLLATEQRALSTLAESAEKAAGAAAAAAGEAAREAEERQRQEIEARRRKEEEERHRREEEARRRAAEEEANRQAELAEQRRRDEEARLIAEAEEAQLQAELAEKHRIAEEARLKVEAEAAELRRIEEVARLKTEAEAAERRRIEDEARRKAEAEAEEIRRTEMEARRQAEADEKQRAAQAAAKLKAEADARRKAEDAEKRRLESEEKQRQQEEAARLKQEAEAKRQAEADEKQRQAGLAAKQKQEAEALRKAEAEEKRKRDAEAKQKQTEEAEQRKQEADAKRQAAAEEKRRQSELAAKQKQEADAKRRAEAEEKQRRDEAARLQTLEAAKLKAEADGKGRQKVNSPQLQATADEKRQTKPAPQPAEKTGPAREKRNNIPFLIAAAIVVIGGAGVAWWATRDRGSSGTNPPDDSKTIAEIKPPPVDPLPPPTPPTPVFHNVVINLTGDAVTSGVVGLKDITLSGHDEKTLTKNADNFALKLKEGTADLNVKLTCTVEGFKLDPATLSLSAAADAQHTISITRETGRVALGKPPADSASFYTHAMLKRVAPPKAAPPGETGMTLAADADVPTGTWTVTLDDDESVEGKPGNSGVTVDSRDAGTVEIKAGQTTAIPLPPGLPALLYSVLEWQAQADPAVESKQAKLLRDMLKKAKLPADDKEVQEVVAGLARTLARPAHDYPLSLVRKDTQFYVLRPQRNKFTALLTLGTDQLAMAAGIAKLVSLPLDLKKLNPAASATGAVPWRGVKDGLVTARDTLSASTLKDESTVRDLITEMGSSLEVLRVSMDNDWGAQSQDVNKFIATWEDATEHCTDVRVAANGAVSLRFAMNAKSRRELMISNSDGGKFPVKMIAGAAEDEKDTFAGSFTALTALPAALAGKVPP